MTARPRAWRAPANSSADEALRTSTNTTNSREAVSGSRYASEQGGLSGLPLQQLSDHVLEGLSRRLADEIPVIAVGGIATPQDVLKFFMAGATAVQLGTVLFSRPELVRAVTSGRPRSTNA